MDKNELQLINLKTQDNKDFLVGYLNNKYLYTSYKVDKDYIKYRKLEKHASLFINIILFILAITTIVIAGYFLYSGGITELFFLQDTNSILVKLFWVCCLFTLYLIYRISSESEEFKEIIKQSYDENNFIKPSVTNLNQWESLHPKERIDVSRSFDINSRLVIDKSFELALRYKHSQVSAYHILLASLYISNEVGFLINRLGINPQTLVDKLYSIANRYEFTDDKVEFDNKANVLLLKIYKFGYLKNYKKISPSLIFATCFLNDENLQEVFYDLGIEIEDVKNTLAWLEINEKLVQRYKRYKSAGKFRSKSGLDRALTSLSTNFLNNFSEDLTRYAQSGFLELAVGRSKETDEVFRIFQSGSKNIILTGEQGVGKKTIIEGIAQRVIGNDVPYFLKEKRIVSLNISSLVAGVNAQEAQERLLNALFEATRAKNVVLFIENIHEIVGISTASSSALDLSAVLSSVLEKNLFYFISTTSNQFYNEIISHSSIFSVLQKVEVEEMSDQDTIQVLESKVGYIEQSNGVIFAYSSLKKIVEYSKRYIHDKFLPTKAILILEELGVYVKNLNNTKTVTSKEVAEFLTQKIGIPIKDIDKAESESLLNIEDLLHQRVIGQDEAIKAVSVALKRARTQLRDINRPIANMLFLGPTGVGKTELVKTIAQVYFNDENNMIRLDMSEYQNSADIYKIIGSPTANSQDAKGYLTQAVKDNPYTIVLLDEFEKAHDDVLNIFLQVMEDGRLTDAKGVTVDFTNTIIIATSNAGSQYIQDMIKQGKNETEIKEGLLEGELKLHFKPELLNRFDNVVVFKPLTSPEVSQVAKLLIDRIASKLQSKGVSLEVTQDFIQDLTTRGYDPLYGARSLRRIIQDEIDNSLADFLLKGKLDRRDIVVLDKGGSIQVKKAEKL